VAGQLDELMSPIASVARVFHKYIPAGVLRSSLEEDGYHLVDRADVALNRATRAALYIRAQHLALSQGAFITLSNALSYELIKPYLHGLVTTEAYFYAEAKDLDWAKVTISRH